MWDAGRADQVTPLISALSGSDGGLAVADERGLDWTDDAGLGEIRPLSDVPDVPLTRGGGDPRLGRTSRILTGLDGGGVLSVDADSPSSGEPPSSVVGVGGTSSVVLLVKVGELSCASLSASVDDDAVDDGAANGASRRMYSGVCGDEGAAGAGVGAGGAPKLDAAASIWPHDELGRPE